MGYVYRGNDTSDAPRRDDKPFNPELCGTSRGYAQHRRLKIKNCPKCCGWHNETRRVRRLAKKEGAL